MAPSPVSATYSIALMPPQAIRSLLYYDVMVTQETINLQPVPCSLHSLKIAYLNYGL
jgi:hypothetical protein